MAMLSQRLRDEGRLWELQRQPRDASASRSPNRDAVDARPRRHLPEGGLSRVGSRELAYTGQLPGITRSSW